MRTTALRRADLRQTLALAPGTLASAQRFLADLRSTAAPLGPAAQAITATAPRLTATLDALPAFQQAAEPALTTAIQVAPLLTELGVQATPVVVRANPTVQALADFARASGPLSTALNVSIDDALGLVEGWARSIQGRDYIGHVFHGRALLGPEFVRSLLSQLTPRASNARRSPAAIATARLPLAQSTAPTSAAPSGGSNPASAPTGPARGLSQILSGIAGNTGSALKQTGGSLTQLLNYLLKP
jgi:hypothetical protein